MIHFIPSWEFNFIAERARRVLEIFPANEVNWRVDSLVAYSQSFLDECFWGYEGKSDNRRNREYVPTSKTSVHI